MNNIRFMEIAPDEKHELRMDAQSHFGTFEVKDDATLYAKVNKLAHSTFDRSKFPVAGSPKITDDGIASGFSTANYLTKTLNINNCTNLKVECVVTVGAKSQNYIFDCLPQVNNLSPLGLRVSNNMYFNFLNTNNAQQTVSNTVANIGDTYFASFELQGTNIIATFKNLSTGVEEIKTAVNASPITINEIKLGVARSIAAPWQGSIDLKQFSITVDGKEVFNGNKEGLDVIKPDDYTVVGSPTITEDGIASGFSSGNILEIPAFTPSDKPWEISLSFTMGSSAGYLFACGKPGDNPIRGVRLNASSSSLALGLSYNGTTLGDSLTASCSLINGNKYNVSIKFTKDGYYQVWLDGVKIGQTNSSKNAIWNSTADKFYIGAILDANVYKEYFRGTIDLNSFKIYVDGQLVYQPCLKIPYKEGQNYVKVVDELYRDRVKDLFEQKGYNGYYTIGEDDFTLPSNKWSDVIEHKENGLTVAEQRVDQTLTIRGACEQGVDVNLPMEFFSADSYAVFGVGTTGTNTASKFTPAADGNYIAIGKGKV